MFLRSKSWHFKNEHLSSTFGHFCSKVLDRCSILGKRQKYHFGTKKVALCISDSSLFCQGAKHVVGVGETHPWFGEIPEKVTPSKMSAKTQSKSTFSRKVRKHYEFPVQLHPEKGKNLVLEQHFRYSRLPKVTQVVDGDRAPAGRPASGLHRSPRSRTLRKKNLPFGNGRERPPPPSLQPKDSVWNKVLLSRF